MITAAIKNRRRFHETAVKLKWSCVEYRIDYVVFASRRCHDRFARDSTGVTYSTPANTIANALYNTVISTIKKEFSFIFRLFRSIRLIIICIRIFSATFSLTAAGTASPYHRGRPFSLQLYNCLTCFG